MRIEKEVDFSDEFNGEDQVHISFTSSCKQQVQRFTMDLEDGSYFNFCTGIPNCILPYNHVYLVFDTEGPGEPVVIPDIGYLGSNLRTKLARSSNSKILRVQLGKHTCYIRKGSVFETGPNKTNPFFEFLVEHGNNILNKDEIFVLDSYVY